MFTEITLVPTEALPITAFRAHLRMGTGFADDMLQDALLERYLRAALAAVEARCGKILIARSFRWTLTKWRNGTLEPVPVGPVQAITGFSLIDHTGAATAAPESGWRLVNGDQSPQLVATVAGLPRMPTHGQVEITLTVGYGITWDAVPADLAQAVLLLAGHFYEFRHAAEGRGVNMPLDIAALIAPHRSVRLGLNGGTS